MLYKLFNYICMVLACERDAFFRSGYVGVVRMWSGIDF